MLSNIESKWRYFWAALLGLFGGILIGCLISSLYVDFIFKRVDEYSPFYPWFFKYPHSQIAAQTNVETLAQLLTVAPILFFAFLSIASMHHGALTQYDNAHFQKQREIKKNGLLAALKSNGFIYAKMGKPKSDAPFISAPPDRFPHAMMIAPTGSGKGVGFVLPNLFHFNGSAIVLDVKGENFQTTSIHRQKALGNRIWYFSPFDWREEGQGGDASTRTHRFNPLKRISKMSSAEQQFTAINTMTDLFLVVDQSSNAASFFEAGRRLFVACCLYAIETNKPTIGEALKILNGGGNKKDSYRTIAGNTLNPKVREIFLTMADQTDKILDSYISVLTGAGLSAWEDPAIDRVTSDSDFDFSTFRKEAQSLFISVQPEHLKTLAPLIRLLFADAIASLQNSEPKADEPHKVMFLMDEFDQLGRQPLVLQSIKTIRSYGGRFFIITQSIPGLESVYNEIERTALLAAAGLQIYMTPQDPKTADVLSNALGKRTIVSKSRSTSQYRSLDDNPNISRRSEERPLISASEILRFPLDEVLILPVGQFPIRASHIRYYEDTHFAPINDAREGHELPYPSLVSPKQDGPLKVKFRKDKAVISKDIDGMSAEEMTTKLSDMKSQFTKLKEKAATSNKKKFKKKPMTA